jgi:hypothetical protein
MTYFGDIIDRKVPRATPELWTSFADKADGAAPTTFDSGQSASYYVNLSGAVAPIVESGVLTGHPTGSGTTANYYKGELADTVTRIGARFRFDGGTTETASVGLAITETELVSATAPSMSVHLAVSPTAWVVGYWSTSLQTLGSGVFDTPLSTDGVTEYEVEAWVDGNTVTVDLPDGGRVSYTNSGIGTYGGPYVFFEQYATVADTDNTIEFTHIWASSGPSPLPNKQLKPWRKVVVLPDGSTSLPAYTQVNLTGSLLYFHAPPSGEILFRFAVPITVSGATDVYLGASWSDGGTTSFILDQVAAGTSVSGKFSDEFLITGLTPGVRYDVAASVFCSAASTMVVDSSAYKFAQLIAEPVYE